MNILLTGGTGFIGQKVVKELIYKKHFLFLLVRKTSNLDNIDCTHKRVKIVYLEDKKNLLKMFKFKKIDLFIHLAGSLKSDFKTLGEFRTINEANVIIPLELLELIAQYRLKKIINISTYLDKAYDTTLLSNCKSQNFLRIY